MDPLERVKRYLSKGDLPGHEFHGNQYTDGQQAADEAAAAPKLADVPTPRLQAAIEHLNRQIVELQQGPAAGDVVHAADPDKFLQAKQQIAEMTNRIGQMQWELKTRIPRTIPIKPAERERADHSKAVRAFLHKGDLPGHEFHGNQWTGGGSGSDKPVPAGYKMSPADIPRAPAKDVPDGEAGRRFREVEDKFANEIAHVGVDAMLARYARITEPDDTQGGKVINTDTFRELSPDYRADRTLASAVHEPASYLAKVALARAMAAPPVSGLALFMAGGSGAGKTSGLEADPELRTVDKQADFTFDSNMNNADKAIKRIDETLATGRQVHIAYVGRDPAEALENGVLPRAERMAAKYGSGRPVRVQEHIGTHQGAADAIRAVHAHYASDPRVHFHYIDNTHGRGNARLSDRNLPNRLNFDNLRSRLETVVNEAHRNGKISDRTRQAVLAKAERASTEADARGIESLGRSLGAALREDAEQGRDSGRAEEVVRKFLGGTL